MQETLSCYREHAKKRLNPTQIFEYDHHEIAVPSVLLGHGEPRTELVDPCTEFARLVIRMVEDKSPTRSRRSRANALDKRTFDTKDCCALPQSMKQA